MDEALQHIRTNFKQGKEVILSLQAQKKLQLTTFPGAWTTDTSNPDFKIKKEIYGYEIKMYVESKAIYKSNLKRAYGLIYGQCSPNLEQNLQAQPSWDGIHSTANLFDLLDLMKGLIFKFDNNKHPYHSLSKAVVEFHCLHQPFHQRDEDFLKEFKATFEVVHQNGGLLGGHPMLIMRGLQY